MKYLRELAKDFAQRNIGLKEYREQRKKLIRGILRGDIQVPQHKFLAPLTSSPEQDLFLGNYEEDPRATTQISAIHPQEENKNKHPPPFTPISTNSSEQKFSSWLLAIFNVAILVLIASLVTLFIVTTKDNDMQTLVTTKTISTKHVETADKLIRNFLALDNWQPEQLQKFQETWEKIDPQKQLAATSLPIVHELRNIIYRKILEEQTMIGLAITESSSRERQKRLIDFARSIGITDPSIIGTP